MKSEALRENKVHGSPKTQFNKELVGSVDLVGILKAISLPPQLWEKPYAHCIPGA
jgi:hypothetical protein